VTSHARVASTTYTWKAPARIAGLRGARPFLKQRERPPGSAARKTDAPRATTQRMTRTLRTASPSSCSASKSDRGGKQDAILLGFLDFGKVTALEVLPAAAGEQSGSTRLAEEEEGPKAYESTLTRRRPCFRVWWGREPGSSPPSGASEPGGSWPPRHIPHSVDLGSGGMWAHCVADDGCGNRCGGVGPPSEGDAEEVDAGGPGVLLAIAPIDLLHLDRVDVPPPATLVRDLGGKGVEGVGR
jgi:hypothetical protein